MIWELVKRCTVKISNPNHGVVGTGFFISREGHLLTCAHVVAAAGGWEQVRIEEKPVSLVYLGESNADDVAVLQLADYRGEAVPLSLEVQPMSHFLSIGYGRPDFPEGGSIDGAMTDFNPHSNFANLPMLRLRVWADAQRVQAGYSGSPVFGTKTQAVVGLIAAFDHQQGALAVPLATLQEKWQQLGEFLAPKVTYQPTPTSGSKRVFLSYRSQDPDLSLAQEFYEAIKSWGHEPFMAGESIKLGENWAQRIDQELERADYFLLLLSPKSATSEMVTEEVRRAKELQSQSGEGKPVILPVRVNFPLSSPLNYDLRGYLQRIQQREWYSAADTQAILQEIGELLAAGNAPEPLTIEVEAAPAMETVDAPPLPVAEPELLREPGGTVPLKSGLYVERPPIETDCFREILQPGALIRVRAPRQMGKTSLMARIINYAQGEGYQAIPITFQRADGRIFGDLELFLRWFCEQVGRRLKKLNQLDDYWRGSGIKDRCTAYFEECLLEEIDTPLVLGLDEVDLVFPQRQVASEFFSLLRSWYESARYGDFNSELWEKLRLVVVHSTEVYVPLDINQSPFNVGMSVTLKEFNLAQTQDLARRYGLNWFDSEQHLTQLQELIGGHPYLVRKAFYHLRRDDLTLQELEATAATEAGIFYDHLRRHLLVLQQYPELCAALRQVVSKSKPVELSSEAAFKLDSMGLIERQGNGVVPRCDLYRYYFRNRLGG